MQREIMTSIPFLSQPSAAAENTEEDLAVAQDLKDTLDAHRNGCVGMAANMIGVPKRIIAFVDEDFGGRDPFPSYGQQAGIVQQYLFYYKRSTRRSVAHKK